MYYIYILYFLYLVFNATFSNILFYIYTTGLTDYFIKTNESENGVLGWVYGV